MKQPPSIMDAAPWFIPLFCFLAGYYLNTIIEVKIKNQGLNHENKHQSASRVRETGLLQFPGSYHPALHQLGNNSSFGH